MPIFASGMQKGTGNTIYHVLAIVIVAIWGLTFISTKVLLMAGLSPEDFSAVISATDVKRQKPDPETLQRMQIQKM